MADRISEAHRSWNMSRIKGHDTQPEIAVRSMLHQMGYRFRLHRDDLPGTPDIVLPKYDAVILVHGCFWHRHEGCQFAYMPKSRVGFWENKFQKNVERDSRQRSELEESGWRVRIVWECEIKHPEDLADNLRSFLEQDA